MADAISLLLLPFAASVAFVLVHAYFGVHVLRRNVVFADLALAQLAALGASVAFAEGYTPTGMAGFGYALLFTAIGAVLLTLSRRVARFVSREAFVGILYVVATAATVLVIDRSPQGAEHVKRILVGSILTVGPSDIAKFGLLYLSIGALHWLLRRPLLAVSAESSPRDRTPLSVSVWDFVFFLSFGIVVTSSVTTAGVLLVFSFLIVPPVIGMLFTRTFGTVLAIAWSVGVVASAAGLAGSYDLDMPTGAAMVVAFALALVVAGLVRYLVFDPERRSANLRRAVRTVIGLVLLLVLASSLWLIVNPSGDQPLLALFEGATGLEPTSFLKVSDRDIFESARRDMVRFQVEVDRLDAKEKAARYEGAPLPDEEIRRIASYQQSFNEMTRGERFVQNVLRVKARERERWLIGLPAIIISVAGLGLLARRRLRTEVSAH